MLKRSTALAILGYALIAALACLSLWLMRWISLPQPWARELMIGLIAIGGMALGSRIAIARAHERERARGMSPATRRTIP